MELNRDKIIVQVILTSKCTILVCMFVLGFYGPINNEVMSSQSVNSGTVPGQA